MDYGRRTTKPAVTLAATMTWLRESTDWVIRATLPLRTPTKRWYR